MKINSYIYIKLKKMESIQGIEGMDDFGDISDDNCNKTSDYRKYNGMPDDFRLNRMMRDRDFKLGRTNFYSFKDTLGDWDERSTQILIEMVQKHPKAHFLLSQKTERRLDYWGHIHVEILGAGYSFTVLQLRMRWREVLRKYRWTVDYNDQNSIRKTCEYMDEMNQLFGEWDQDATLALFEQIKQIKDESAGKQLIRIGYAGWERITSYLIAQGHRFNVYKVEARWRNLVNLYKTMVDHNAMPHVQPYSIAYQEQLSDLVVYEPNRRKRYERQKGKRVTQERFPEKGTQLLLQLYKDNIQSFHNPSVNNTLLWEEIRQKMEDAGHVFTTIKLKDILTGIIKGYENCQYHNSLPGAIRREVPYYRELSEIYDVFRCWPHIKNRRSLDTRVKRKFRLRLQSSQQLWSTDESRMLLQVYPDVLEAHVNQAVVHNVNQQQPSDLWLQVAKSYQATGKTLRDVPEIAIHMGLLRQGYSQGNNFPFMDEMRRVKEMEEAVCYSPDVSKFTGDIEVIYWSHEAVHKLLDLYVKHQKQLTNSSRESVFAKITLDLNEAEYKYTIKQVISQFQLLISQYKARMIKTRIKPQAGRTLSIPAGAPYESKLREIYQLREDLSLSWTNNVKNLPKDSLKTLFEVSNLKFKEFFSKRLSDTEIPQQMQQVIQSIRLHIKDNNLMEHVPETRQVRHHLIKALKLCEEEKEENKVVKEIFLMLKDYDYANLLHGVLTEDLDKEKPLSDNKKSKLIKSASSNGLNKRKRKDFVSEVNQESSNEDELSTSKKFNEPNKSEIYHEIDDIPDNLSISLSFIQDKFEIQNKSFNDGKQVKGKDLTITITSSKTHKPNSIIVESSKKVKCEDFDVKRFEKVEDTNKMETYNDTQNLRYHDTAKKDKRDMHNSIHDNNVELTPKFTQSKDQTQIELRIKGKTENTERPVIKSQKIGSFKLSCSTVDSPSRDNSINTCFSEKSNEKPHFMLHPKKLIDNDEISHILDSHRKKRKQEEEELFSLFTKHEKEKETLTKEMLGLFNSLIGKV